VLSTLSSSESTTDFVCPHCGVSAFEVIPEPIEESGDGSGPALFMRCFGCDHVFQHTLEDVLDVVADKLTEISDRLCGPD
jgi:hypothetical protein